MRILPPVPPTPEQLLILAENRPGIVLITGAAGSGKTTTALLRLKQLCGSWLSRKRRLGLAGPVRVLVLTYNRTLEGYIEELARGQVKADPDLHLEILTFGKFALGFLDNPEIVDSERADQLLKTLGQPLGMDANFLRDEVEYVLGRFEPSSLDDYITARRDGRGVSPRMDAATRQRLLDEVIHPYNKIKGARGEVDWNDIAVAAGEVAAEPWDVVIVDEAQDFSANQIRTILSHLSEDHSATFVMDATQRIYPRSFTWKEAGARLSRVHTLKRNYRNTRQIAAFARPLVEGLHLDDDGALPDFTATQAVGPKPQVIAGTYGQQIEHIIGNLVQSSDLANESFAFLQPRGGKWFSYLKDRLDNAGIGWVELTRASTWPGGTAAVALCTLHSAKGLEFDHVVIPGLNQQVTPHGVEEGDAQFEGLRRLVAMGVGRARKSVTIGYKPGEASTLIGLLRADTYEKVTL
ncbi:3'-5' exonuclease [Arthrobacter sp. NPDC058130]|uniref:3'-5' exonuclease n=1 Tax=Arthrobacter sp. NPDC058130 TaxID=3346353 RepID=UPI0036E07ACF